MTQRMHPCCLAPVYGRHAPSCDHYLFPMEYRPCKECGGIRDDCNVAADGLCRDCDRKHRVRIRPSGHDYTDFPVAKGVEERLRLWLVSVDAGTVEGYVDILSQVDVAAAFDYASASKELRGILTADGYVWNGIEVFDPKRNNLDSIACRDRAIWENQERLVWWMRTILNHHQYRWLALAEDWERSRWKTS